MKVVVGNEKKVGESVLLDRVMQCCIRMGVLLEVCNYWDPIVTVIHNKLELIRAMNYFKIKCHFVKRCVFLE